MKNILLFFFTLMSLYATAQVNSKGAMSEMAKNNFAPAIQLDTLLKRPHLYGLGPYGKMQGEITVVNGTPIIATGRDADRMAVKKDKKAKAPFFVYAYVDAWKSVKVKVDINSPKDIELAVKNQALAHGYSLSQPFPFRIKGTFNKLNVHVVSPRSADVAGYKEGIASYKYEFLERKGEILGFYSETSHGIYTPASSNIHIHFISKDKREMGHIDGITVSSETELEILLPLKPSERQ